CQQETDWSPTF
nr:immunoglobulin light chain junction region [Macaca mulatta]